MCTCIQINIIYTYICQCVNFECVCVLYSWHFCSKYATWLIISSSTMFKYIYTYTHIHTHARTHAHIYVYIYTFVYTHAHKRTHTYKHKGVCPSFSNIFKQNVANTYMLHVYICGVLYICGVHVNVAKVYIFFIYVNIFCERIYVKYINVKNIYYIYIKVANVYILYM